MATRIGINGFGRIGRQVTKALIEKYGDSIDIVAVNDLADAKTNALLFKYDSNYGRFPGDVTVEGTDFAITFNGKTTKIKGLSVKNPAELPWKDLGVEIVIESTGLFLDERARLHLEAGAKKVLLSAPGKGDEDFTVVLGVNDDKLDLSTQNVISNASCTTNCLAPVAKVLNDSFGVKYGLMTTIHSYTNDQHVLDVFHKDPRRARAAALNMIPTTTGAAKAIGLVIPELKGKMHGMSMRVPTPTVSVVDLVVEVEKATTVDEVKAALKAAAEGPLAGILGFSEEPLVSMDFKGDERSSIVDAENVFVMQGTQVKVLSWYDNEMGYSVRLADLTNMVASKL